MNNSSSLDSTICINFDTNKDNNSLEYLSIITLLVIPIWEKLCLKLDAK